MTKSQVTTAISGAVSFISGVTTAATPFLPFIPERHKPNVMLVLGLLAAAGAGLASFSQSLSGQHVSLPVAEAKALATGGDAALVGAALDRIRESTAAKS
jgi:hypothetical protein